MVVGVFLGGRPTAGYGVEIVGVREEHGALVVEYGETRPPAARITAQVLTAPYHLVRFPSARATCGSRKSSRTSLSGSPGGRRRTQ